MALPTTIVNFSLAVPWVGPFQGGSLAAQITISDSASSSATGAGFINAQTIVPAFPFTLRRARAKCARMSSSNGNLYIKVYSGSPAGTLTLIGTSISISVSGMPNLDTGGVHADFDFSFPNPPQLDAGSTYTVAIEGDGTSFASSAFGANTYASGGRWTWNGSAWIDSTATNDVYLTLYGGGNRYYAVGRDVSDATVLRISQAVNPDVGWGQGNGYGFSTAGIQQISGFAYDNIIHLAVIDGTATAANLRYFTFSMELETFTSEVVQSAFNPQSSTLQTLNRSSIVRRPDGTIVIAYNGARVANMGASYSRTVYARRAAGGGWTNNLAFDSGGLSDSYCPEVVLGGSGRVHFLWLGATNLMNQRALNSANVLQTANSITVTGGITPLTYDTKRLSYDDAGTIRVIAQHLGASNTGRPIYFNSADVPTLAQVASAITAKVPDGPSGLYADGADAYYLFRSAADSDLYTLKSLNDGATWGSETLVFASDTLSADAQGSRDAVIYQRGTNVVIPYIVNDNGTLKYNEAVVRTLVVTYSGSAAGTSTATAFNTPTIGRAATAAGTTPTVLAQGRSVKATDGLAGGTSNVLAVGSSLSIAQANGVAAGTSSVPGVGRDSVSAAAGTAAGTANALGNGWLIISTVGTVTIGIASPYSPSSVAGLILWIDAADSATITQSVGKVSAIANKGTVGGAFVQANAAKQFTLATTAKGPALQNVSAGTDFCMAFNGSTNVFDIREMSAIVVARRETDSSSFSHVLSRNDTGNVRGWRIGWSWISSSTWLGATFAQTDPDNGFATSEAQVHTYSNFNTAFLADWRRDAAGLTGNAAGWPQGSPYNQIYTVPRGACGLVLGGQYNSVSGGPVGEWRGDIHEVLFFDRPITQTDIHTIEGYLSWKWGLVIEYPSHPYKNAAPVNAGVGVTAVGRNASVAATGTAAGTSSVTANGYLEIVAPGAGSAAGTPSVLAVAAASAVMVGNASGTSGVDAIGQSVTSGIGTSDGTAAVAAVMNGTANGKAVSDGLSTVVGATRAYAGGAAISIGAATAVAVGNAITISTGVAAGTSVAPGVIKGLAFSVGNAAGAGAANGKGLSLSAGPSPGTAAGIGTASGVGRSINAAKGTAGGTSAVDAVGIQVAMGAGIAAGAAAALATSAWQAAAKGSAAGSSSALADGILVALGAGRADGTSTITAVIKAVVIAAVDGVEATAHVGTASVRWGSIVPWDDIHPPGGDIWSPETPAVTSPWSPVVPPGTEIWRPVVT